MHVFWEAKARKRPALLQALPTCLPQERFTMPFVSLGQQIFDCGASRTQASGLFLVLVFTCSCTVAVAVANANANADEERRVGRGGVREI